jgi:hypothetical protein
LRWDQGNTNSRSNARLGIDGPLAASTRAE